MKRFEKGMKVTILESTEYQGRYKGCWGYVRKVYAVESKGAKIGVEMAGYTNMASKDGLYWFMPDSLRINYDYRIPQEKRDLIDRVMFQPPATIIFWTDGTKTVVKAQNGDDFDPEKGMAMAIAKKFFGNKGSYFEKIKKHVTKEWIEKKEAEA